MITLPLPGETAVAGGLRAASTPAATAWWRPAAGPARCDRDGPEGGRPSMPWLAAVLACPALLVPALLGAQQSPAGEPGDTLDARRSAVLRSLRPGQRVRVGLPGAARVEGDVLRLQGDTLLFRPDGRAGASRGGDGFRPVSPEALERLWTRTRSVGRGALIGGAAGALPGAVFGHELGEFACAETGEDCGLEGALLGGAIFGAGGALLGAGVGALIPRWSLKFP